MKTVNWVLPLATVATLVLLVGFLGQQLIADAGGALPFDLRVTGYDLIEAQAYLTELNPAGLALYLGAVRMADTLLPLLLTATLCLPLWRRGQLWFLPALAYGLFDLAENVAVARLLRAGPEVEAHAVAVASGFTQAKFVCLAIAAALALIALAQKFFRR